MVMQVCDPAKAQDWLERSKGEEGRETMVEGYRGAGERPDTMIIRLMDNNSLKMPFDLLASDSEGY